MKDDPSVVEVLPVIVSKGQGYNQECQNRVHLFGFSEREVKKLCREFI